MGRPHAVSRPESAWSPRALVGLTLMLLGALGLAGSAWLSLRGQGPSAAAAPPRLEPWVEPGLGVNVDLIGRPNAEIEAVVGFVEGSGMGWVRQHFRWLDLEPEPGDYRWELSDGVVERLAATGLELVAVLGTSPNWARPPGQEHAEWSPPEDLAVFGDFAARFARRYGDHITYYQIWDQPNIYPFWGDRYVDVDAYGRLLREGASRIRAEDGDAVIVLAGLAPNVENGPLNLNEVEYLRRLLNGGAGPFFDVVAAKAYGFEVGPEDPRVDVGALNFGRAALLRQVLEEFGRAQTPVWAVEFGWNALPSDWAGRPAPWGTGDPRLQAERSAQALARARREWPWMGPAIWARLTPPEDPDDPGYGFALAESDLTLTALGSELLPLLETGKTPAIGWHRPSSSWAAYSPGWRVSDQGADPGGAGDWVEIAFGGTALDLVLRPGPYWAVWYVEVDGGPSSVLPSWQGRSYLVLYDPLGSERQVTVASGLPPREHRVRIMVEGGWGQWPLAGWVSWQEEPANAAPVALAVSAVALVAGWAVGRPGRLVAEVLSALVRAGDRLPEVVGALIAYGAGVAFWAAEGLPLSAVSGAVLAGMALVAPRWVLSAALASLPFFLVSKSLAGLPLLMPEVLAWLLLVGCLTRRWIGTAPGRLRLTPMDVAVGGLLVCAGLASLAAPLRGVAFHDLRRVLVSGTALYAATRMLGSGALGPAVMGALAGAAATSLVGIGQYLRGEDLIRAGEVARVRALYGSPNNLALYLGRCIPLAAALALFARRRLLRLLAGLAAIACLTAGVLTRSRGLVFLGLPAGLGLLLWHWDYLRRRRALLALVGVAGVLLVALTAGGRVRGLLTGTDSAATMRLHLWASSVQMIRDRPWLGVGPDNFLYQYRTRYILPPAWQEPNLSHPHNVLLDFWLTAGLGGAVAIGALLAWSVVCARRAVARSVGWRRAAYLGVAAALLAALAQGLVDNSLFLVDLSHVTLGYLAMLAGGAVAPSRPGRRRGPPVKRPSGIEARSHESADHGRRGVHRFPSVRAVPGPRARSYRHGQPHHRERREPGGAHRAPRVHFHRLRCD